MTNQSVTMPMQPFGPENLPVSRISLGCMGLAGTWNPKEVGPDNIKKAVTAFETALEAGITFYDHADIYGGTACESVFKECLRAVPGSRERIFIATKVGIRAGYYDHSPEHIRTSIRASLDRMGIEYVDCYQLHRPDPLANPEQTAETLQELLDAGLIRSVGISNYYPQQTLALKRFLKAPIVSNQIAISLLHLPPIYEGREGQGGDGVLDQCEELGITPLAYSPLGGGWLSGRREVPADHANRERIERVLTALRDMGAAYGGATPGQIALAWLLAHPAKIIPIVGSTNPEHIREAAGAAQIQLSRTDWYKLWVASRGANVP